ncbi:hypothetical protein EX30DRAFT_66916 [Ascodesmis nigricans]|uniref:Uncharacterized protein n=1 Tax=Ascodesmis nigricans TaxID=341454 RepID=A0A4S2MU38_9PEZI|nr:hypothetical protein EX30DRAFT_66916 [Ascodesmis nigricans]
MPGGSWIADRSIMLRCCAGVCWQCCCFPFSWWSCVVGRGGVCWMFGLLTVVVVFFVLERAPRTRLFSWSAGSFEGVVGAQAGESGEGT